MYIAGVYIHILHNIYPTVWRSYNVRTAANYVCIYRSIFIMKNLYKVYWYAVRETCM